MSAKGKKERSFYYRQTHGRQNYNVKNYWCPGDEIKEDDEVLLKEVREYYQKNNYPPSRGDLSIEYVCRLKARFRTWKNVLEAAEIPRLNSAEAQRERKEAAKKRKNMSEKKNYSF